MKIALIGTGNVAFHLAQALTNAKSGLSWLYGRDREAVAGISAVTGVPVAKEIPDADLYLICVSDRAIAEVSKLIKKTDCLVAHTSGSLPCEILAGPYRRGCFYPLQTFSKAKPLVYSEIPFFTEAEADADAELLTDLAKTISPMVKRASYEKRKYIHLTAVFTCNFVNHLFTVGNNIADSQQIPFEYFHPLIRETVAKSFDIPPFQAQTGPAVRGDQRVLDLHRQLIQDRNQLEIYNAINHSISEMYHGQTDG